MESVTQQATMKQADELLALASEELCKPAEDVVDYLVCNNAYKAVKLYLVSYLLNNGHTGIDADTHTKELIDECRAIDPKFNDVDLCQLYNKAEGADVFMDLKTAREFMAMAKATKALVQ